MKTNQSTKYAIAVGFIIAISVGIFIFKDSLELLFGPKKAVNKALTMIKTQKPDGTLVFDDRFLTDLMQKYSYYQIDEWKLSTRDLSDGVKLVGVEGTATNGFGAQLKRNPVFVVENKSGEWLVTDSYGFFVFDKLPDLKDKSDMQKHDLIVDMKEKVKIEKWSFEDTGYGAIKGEGVIVNESEIPVSFVKTKIEYYNNNGDLVNTDENYAVSGDLEPGERKQFTWYTGDCNGCKTARIKLIFD